jgi:sigma-B regulation protein RsbU (phosphoserine phosphatase)
MTTDSSPAASEPKGELSRTMRIDLTAEALQQAPGRQAVGVPARPRRPIIRITKPKTVTGQVGDSDFQQLLQNVYDGAVITDLAGQIVETNLRLSQFVGYEHDELSHMSIFDLLYGSDETIIPMIRENLASTRFILLQAYFLRKDSSLFPAETAINRLYLSGQDYLCFFVRDITLRRTAEEQLRTEHTAIQTAGSGIAISDVEARLTYVNPAITRMWGAHSEEALQALTLHDLFSDDATGNIIVEAVAAGRSWEGEIEARHLDGTRFFVQAAATANLDSDDQLVGIVLSFTDVTERRRAEAQREQYAQQLRQRNVEMEGDLHMARQIQQALLPRHYPAFPASAAASQSLLRFSHIYRPSAILGGDFFHVLPIADDRAGVFVCDVMGHGMRAALVTAIVRGLVEELRPVALDPGHFMTRLNHEFMSILRDPEEFMFVSAVYLVFDLQAHQVTLATAGHPSPYLIRPGSRTITPLRTSYAECGPALGISENAVYVHRHSDIQAGDRVVIYTDGILEIEGTDRGEFGDQRLHECLSRHLALDTGAMLERVVRSAEDFGGGHGFDDDICLVAVDVAGLPAG